MGDAATTLAQKMRDIGYFDTDLIARVETAESAGQLSAETISSLHQLLETTKKDVTTIEHEEMEILLELQQDVVRESNQVIQEALKHQENLEQQQQEQAGEELLHMLNKL